MGIGHAVNKFLNDKQPLTLGKTGQKLRYLGMIDLVQSFGFPLEEIQGFFQRSPRFISRQKLFQDTKLAKTLGVFD